MTHSEEDLRKQLKQLEKEKKALARELDRCERNRSLTETAKDRSPRLHHKTPDEFAEPQRQLADIIDFLPVATMVIDIEGRVTTWNQAMESVTGVKRADILGKGNYEYSIPFYGERRPILIDLVFKSDEELAAHYSNIRRDGAILSGEAFIPKLGKDGIFLVAFASALYGTDGSVVGAIESIRDVTKHKRAEEALHKSKEQYRLLAENSDDVIWTTDANLHFTYVSPSNVKLRGVTAEEALNENLEQVMTPDSLNSVLAEYSRLLPEIEQGKDVSLLLDLEEYRKDGSTIWVEASMKTIRDADGHLVGYLGVSRDISERKRMEALREEAAEAVRLSGERYRLIAENSDDVIFTMDSQLRLTYISPSTFKLRGVTAEESMQEKWEDTVTPESLNRLIAEYARVMPEIEKGHAPTSRIEIERYRKDGSTLWIEISIRTMLDSAGRLSGFLGVSRDISERKKQEEALRLSGEQYRLIAENSDDVIFTLDPELHFTYMSPSSYKLRGVTAEDAMQEKLEDIMTPDSLNRVIAEYSQVMAEIEKGHKPTVRIEIEQYRKDRSTLWVEISIRTILDDAGRLTGFLGVSRDISERKKQEEALRESENKYRFLIDNSNDIIWTFDLKTMAYSFCSNAVEPILGYTPVETVGKTLDEIFSPETRAGVSASFGKIVGKDAVTDQVMIEAEHISKDGRKVSMEINAHVRKDQHGRPVALTGISRDITQRKLSEAALKAAEEKYRTILETMDSGYYEVDLKGNLLFCNPALRRFLGQGEDEVLGINFNGFMEKDEADYTYKIFNEVYRSGKPSGDFFWSFAKMGTKGAYWAASAYPMTDNQGAITGFWGTVRDITTMKAMKDAADEANRSKSMFLANMSHEIRTPMNAILGFGQLMERDPALSPQSREHLDIINRSGEHLLALINDILEMSKIEAGRATFVPNTFDLHSLLEDIERMFRMRTDAKHLQFLAEKIGDVPRWVITDEGKLRQVLINLLGNAVKFTDEGGIALRIGARAGKDDTLDLLFEVEDTGPGMAEDELGRLFQTFEQTRSGVKSGGTGLGLALSRGFVQIMGGSISVSSMVGKGTTFSFEIPVLEGSQEQVEPREAKRHVLRLRPGQKEIRVLIVDDREMNRRLLHQLLTPAGFATLEAANGEEALNAVREWKPLVVLMDMSMPVMDGYEATRRIKASPDSRDTMVIAVTASAFEEDRYKTFAAGADAYLAKPFKDTELFETIGRLTGADYLYREPAGTGSASPAADDRADIHRSVAGLPAETVDRLRSAIEGADIDRLNELCAQMDADHPLLAQRVREMAARYEYEALTEIFSAQG